MENYVGVERVMEFLAYNDPDSVYRLVAEGMPCVRLGRRLRFRLSEVDEWIASRGGNGQAGDLLPLPVRRAS